VFFQLNTKQFYIPEMWWRASGSKLGSEGKPGAELAIGGLRFCSLEDYQQMLQNCHGANSANSAKVINVETQKFS
jgi:hypothetical protein